VDTLLSLPFALSTRLRAGLEGSVDGLILESFLYYMRLSQIHC
jgi:hypothetical protein